MHMFSPKTKALPPMNAYGSPHFRNNKRQSTNLSRLATELTQEPSDRYLRQPKAMAATQDNFNGQAQSRNKLNYKQTTVPKMHTTQDTFIRSPSSRSNYDQRQTKTDFRPSADLDAGGIESAENTTDIINSLGQARSGMNQTEA